MTKKVILPIAFLLMVGLSALSTADAYVFYIDQFQVTRNGTVLFVDNFSDGIGPRLPNVFPPISYPGTGLPSGYYGAGPLDFMFPPGTEADGKLKFDSTYAVTSSTNIPGTTAIIQNARLNNNSFVETKLTSTDRIAVSGVFDLIAPGPGEAYGIRLYDRGPTPGTGGFLDLRVRKDYDGLTPATVMFRRGDYFTDSGFTYINPSTIEETNAIFGGGYDEIRLILENSDSAKNTITAKFTYLDLDGSLSPLSYAFVNTGNIFNWVDYTEVEFQAAKGTLIQPVPEPSTMLLLGSGLAGLIGYGRRRLKK